MKVQYKVGDRVKVYGQLGKGTMPTREYDYYTADGDTGVVTYILNSTELTVLLSNPGTFVHGYEVIVHPNQCRKLKKRV